MGKRYKIQELLVRVRVGSKVDGEMVESRLRKCRRIARMPLQWAKAKEYNGYSNYETWAAHLWMTNDPASVEKYKGMAEDARTSAKDHPNTGGVWTEQQAIRFILADAIKAELDAGAEGPAGLRTQSSLYADLLNSVLSDIDYHELAEAFLELD